MRNGTVQIDLWNVLPGVFLISLLKLTRDERRIPLCCTVRFSQIESMDSCHEVCFAFSIGTNEGHLS